MSKIEHDLDIGNRVELHTNVPIEASGMKLNPSKSTKNNYAVYTGTVSNRNGDIVTVRLNSSLFDTLVDIKISLKSKPNVVQLNEANVTGVNIMKLFKKQLRPMDEADGG